MKIIRDPEKLQAVLEKERRKGRSVGFVPTMGALHEGHLSLARASNRENAVTVVSIFVNPTQFGPKEDLAKYPRPVRKDLNFLRAEKVDFLLMPSAEAMYPEGFGTFVEISPKLANVLCGKFRPGHFRGVATVMAKLLNIVGPCRLYMGAKDYQQTAVTRRLVSDLNMAVQVRVMPTVREKGGLAMSSRNRFLSASGRRRALAISRALLVLKQGLLKKKGALAALKAQSLRELKKSVDRVQYFEVVDPTTLRPLQHPQGEMVALAACFVDKTRLIDNVTIRTRSV